MASRFVRAGKEKSGLKGSLSTYTPTGNESIVGAGGRWGGEGRGQAGGQKKVALGFSLGNNVGFFTMVSVEYAENVCDV